MKVILLMAVTADGMIAKNANHAVDWTGSEDKRYFVHVTRKAGVMIMGSRTFDMIGKALPGRKNIVMTRDKKRQSHDKNLVFTNQSPETIIDDLHAHGFKLAVLIGGSIINTIFLKKNLIDECHITIVPRFFGRGLALFDKSCDTKLELISNEKLANDHVLLKYLVKK